MQAMMALFVVLALVDTAFDLCDERYYPLVGITAITVFSAYFSGVTRMNEDIRLLHGTA